MSSPLLHEKVWLEKNKYEEAEVKYHMKLVKIVGLETLPKNNINNTELNNSVDALEKENAELKKLINDLQALVQELNSRIEVLETASKVPSVTPAVSEPEKDKKEVEVTEEEEDDDVDLFGSDSEDENDEANRVKEARIAEYYAKKSKKPQLIAKSNIILDVKPWDDETNMQELEAVVREIKMDGLLWGTGKLIPVAYGIFKLQISCVVEDEKVSVETLEENIKDLEDYVSSVDIVGFNKV